MIFETLNESANRGELILVDGGFCHWHLRKDGQVTIREIIVLPEHRGMGIGTEMVETLKKVVGATSLFAKCPIDLPANRWYEHIGFKKVGGEQTASGRELVHWRMMLVKQLF